ncbi:MAG TPA: methyltransferase domain-containing protein [Thermoanaerobaculia bacterium]|jgi:SAM-dependent methyltransferase|nr:methyltransferase domain-containing protein [Thermoanaerobaculia bacterium]
MPTVHEVFREIVQAELASHPTRHAQHHREFALQRPREGQKALEYLRRRYAGVFTGPVHILDVGGGNGGFLLPFAEQAMVECIWIDRHNSAELSYVAHQTGVGVRRALADATAIPLASQSIDVVLYVETIEHVPALAVGREIARVLRPGGICYMTTPARFRYLFQKDPHYGIPALLVLPDFLQRRASSALRPTEPYEVRHLFWSAWGIARSLPGLRVVEVTSKNWEGFLRRFDWDWLVLKKPQA